MIEWDILWCWKRPKCVGILFVLRNLTVAPQLGNTRPRVQQDPQLWCPCQTIWSKEAHKVVSYFKRDYHSSSTVSLSLSLSLSPLPPPNKHQRCFWWVIFQESRKDWDQEGRGYLAMEDRSCSPGFSVIRDKRKSVQVNDQRLLYFIFKYCTYFYLLWRIQKQLKDWQNSVAENLAEGYYPPPSAEKRALLEFVRAKIQHVLEGKLEEGGSYSSSLNSFPPPPSPHNQSPSFLISHKI